MYTDVKLNVNLTEFMALSAIFQNKIQCKEQLDEKVVHDAWSTVLRVHALLQAQKAILF